MVVGEFLPFLFMLVVQMGYAGMNITSKVAMDAGMKPLVLVAYRQIFATLVIAPLAYIFEWKTRPKITKAIVFQIFLCSLTGTPSICLVTENSCQTLRISLCGRYLSVTFWLIYLWATGHRKGALYASVFSPFMLIMVAIFSWALLREKLYVGTAVGSVLIVVGLYTVLWGKDKEAKKAIEEEQVSKPDINGIDLEFQQTATPYSYSNGNRRSPI
ncbi:WAT1-related protein [Tripterygium wilfordii]|uniref:WAT1-related protein n=1 Tax=Tripterygium wilfordii TaxID=458696 RepID=A0A7J7D0V3_TRIWF|nr:WAT1-related protein [Tripterygium wilfordii]